MTNFKLAPLEISKVPTGEEIAKKLKTLIGTRFPLSDKPRTNGANLRKLITKVLDDGSVQVSGKEDFVIVPFKKKGVPRLLACLCDTYIVTTGDTYNLQVWNRQPNTSDILVKYTKDASIISCKDIKFIFAKIDPDNHEITSIIVATPQYIVDKFGQFGVPTIKYQMIIGDLKRGKIIRQEDKCLFKDDTENLAKHSKIGVNVEGRNISAAPRSGDILPLREIKGRIVDSLIGLKVEGPDTKTKGQFLERIIANLLGYDPNSPLVGGYPDIPNQLLEVKVQDSPTVDLGKYSPSNPVVIDKTMGLKTEDVRYVIALTNSKGIIEGLVISPGKYLCGDFTFVSGTNYKCQRSIPMTFFTKENGKSIFNP